jgi:CRP-like cAMP-binding protein
MGLSAHDWDIVLQAPLFKAMGPTISRAIIQDRPPRHYARGEQIFQEGDPAEGFFVVIEGWAKLLRLRDDGEEVVVAIFSAGETFAEVAMFLGGRYPASCEAVSPARILKVDAAVLRRAILAQPQLAFDMLAAASLRLRELVDEIERLKAQSAPQRIADFFLKQAAADSGRAEIALPYEKALIANRLGMKPESFSRALGKLEAFGVTVNRESVCISDLARLAAFVDGHEERIAGDGRTSRSGAGIAADPRTCETAARAVPRPSPSSRTP